MKPNFSGKNPLPILSPVPREASVVPKRTYDVHSFYITLWRSWLSQLFSSMDLVDYLAKKVRSIVIIFYEENCFPSIVISKNLFRNLRLLKFRPSEK